MNKKLKNDLILATAALLLAAISFLVPRLFLKPGLTVSVQRNGVEIARYSLTEDGQYPLAAGDKTNLLVIKDGKASVAEASCPDGICVHHAPISKARETIICLPNRLVIEILGDSDDGPDAIA